MKVLCIAGKNDIAVNILKYAQNRYGHDCEIVAVLNRHETGIDSWQHSLKLYCQHNSIRIVALEDLYALKDIVFVSAEFDRIIEPSKFNTSMLFNIHFSLLPKYKGSHTSVFPILNDETETGVTLHYIRAGIDTGEIIAQKKINILYDDTSLDLYRKLVDAGSQLVITHLDQLINRDEIPGIPQSPLHSTYYARNAIDYKNLHIELRRTAAQIHNQVRAFAFRPYQLLTFRGQRLIGSKITDMVSTLPPGNVLDETDVYIRLSTIDYDILLYKDTLPELLDCILCYNNKRAKALCEFEKIGNEQDEQGRSPLAVAFSCNNHEMVEFLQVISNSFSKNHLDKIKINYNAMSRAEQSRAEQSRAEQSRAELV